MTRNGQKQKIIVASDHGGFELKTTLIETLKNLGMEVEDLGTNNTESVDYPDFAKALATRVASGEFERGLLCCGTGIGISIAANKVAGIRAAVVSDVFSAKMSRAHNNANILCLGERVLDTEKAREILKIWLETNFEGGRHENRVRKIHEIESS